MDRAGFQAWLDRYVEAWRSNDPEDIKALFTEDAGYSYGPFRDDDLKSRDAIVESWLEEPDKRDRLWDARYEAWAVDGDRGVAHGLTRYHDGGGAGDDPDRRYENVYLVEFAPDGRCRDFREFYMEPPAQVRKRVDEKVAEAVGAAQAQAKADSDVAAAARELSDSAVVG